jgi:tetratricopeptide (TPR) repeat protein
MTGPVIAPFAVVALLVAPLVLSAPRPAVAATSQAAQGAVEQELLALDKKVDDAARRRDVTALEDLLTDDFKQVTPTGVRTKAEALKVLAAQATAAPPPPPALEPTYTVQVYGDTALITHITKQTDPHDPAPGFGVMHMFVRQQGRWKMAGSSSTPAQPSAERSINSAGYALMADGKVKEAIELFKMNVQLYPQSWNVYDSLGEAYANAGETALAVQNYEKSLQLNPKNDTGKAALAKLKAK